MKFAPDYVVLFWFSMYRIEAPRDDLRMSAFLGGEAHGLILQACKFNRIGIPRDNLRINLRKMDSSYDRM